VLIATLQRNTNETGMHHLVGARIKLMQDLMQNQENDLDREALKRVRRILRRAPKAASAPRSPGGTGPVEEEDPGS
jgi:hypothetical protein